MLASLRHRWERFWMHFAGQDKTGRIAARLAAAFAPPYMARIYLSQLTDNPFVDPCAVIHHRDLRLGKHAFVADRVIVHQAAEGGSVSIGDGSRVLRDSVLETGLGGRIEIGSDTFLHPRSQVMAYVGSVSIGNHATIAPNCAFYAYNHGTRSGDLVKKQPLTSKGGISIGDGAWLGFGVIVLDGVTIGEGAVIGAGAVVTKDIPADAIAIGSPARVVSMRDGAREERNG